MMSHHRMGYYTRRTERTMRNASAAMLSQENAARQASLALDKHHVYESRAQIDPFKLNIDMIRYKALGRIESTLRKAIRELDNIRT